MTSNWTPIVNVELLDFNCWVGLFVVFFWFFFGIYSYMRFTFMHV